MRCGNCGYENPGEARFCVRCGTGLAPEPERTTGRKGWYVAIGILSAAIVVLVVALAMRGRGEDSNLTDAKGGTLAESLDTNDDEQEKGDKALLQEYEEELGIKRYEVDYLWQARDESNAPWFRWSVGDGVDDGAAVGSRISDFDGDGADELLVVRWSAASVRLEMYEVHDGSADLANAVSEYESAFPVEGVGALDVLIDEADGIDVQWTYGKSPAMDGHWWHLDRYTYDGKKFKPAGEVSMDGTGIYEYGRLKSELSDLGLPTDSIPDVDKDDLWICTLLADTETSLDVVARFLVQVNDSPTYTQITAIRKSGDSDWTKPKRLGSFVITQKAEVWPSSSDSDDDATRKGADAAVWFIRTWYDDWSLDGDSKQDNAQIIADRCLPLVDESSQLYQTIGGTPNNRAAYSERPDASTCVVEEPELVSESDGTYRVSLWYTSDQEANWDGKSYKWLVEDRRHEASWDVTVNDKGKVTKLELVQRGPYTLSGTMRAHDEDFNGGKITVLSLVLDDPVAFKAEYKGTLEGEAAEVAISTSQADSYAKWAGYRGRRITVECEGLGAAVHDASQYDVDAVATGDVRLVDAEDPDDDDAVQAGDVVHLDVCDLTVPAAWRGKVAQGQYLDDVTLEWEGHWMLCMRQCPPGSFSGSDKVLDSYELDGGRAVTIHPGSDNSFDAHVDLGSGKELVLYLFAYNDDLEWFFDMSEDECRDYFELQAAAAGMSVDDDPNEVAIAALKACIAGLQFTDEDLKNPGLEDTSDDPLVVSLGTWRVELPEYWRDKVELESTGAQGHGRIAYLPGNDARRLADVQEAGESDYLDSMPAVGTVTLKSGEKATVRRGEDGYVYFSVHIEGQRYLRVATLHHLQVQENMGSMGPTSDELERLADLQSLGKLQYTTADDFSVPLACLQAIASGTTLS